VAALAAVVGVCAVGVLILRSLLPAQQEEGGEQARNFSGAASPSASPGTRPLLPTKPIWRPSPGVTWQWQLTTPVDQSVDAAVYDIDLFENPASVVAALHAAGRRVVCYVSVGSWEPYRPDAARFPPDVVGAPVEGWPDERWLDVRQVEVLEPIMAARFDLCRSKGFDAVEPDLVDAYAQRSGFHITAADQLRYNRRIAALAHERGLAVGLKNDGAQVRELAGSFDFAVVEECVQYDECAEYTPFVKAGKAVLHAEYGLEPQRFCPSTAPLGFSSIRKRVDLGAYREPC
jgi:hypothetical protein